MDAVTDGRYRLIGFGGGIRGTKTFGSLSTLIALCRIYPRSRWAVIRKDLQRLRDTTIPSYEKLRQLTGGFMAPVNQQRWESEATNGSVILFRGESIDKDPELLRFHGYEVNGFLNEEADELSERTLVKEIERAGTWIIPDVAGEPSPQPIPYILNTFNPCAGWPRRRFYTPWKTGTIQPPYCFIPTTAADNPHISDAQREAWKEMPENEYRRFVLGDWEALTGAYYDALSVDHLVDLEDCPWWNPVQKAVNYSTYWRYWSSTDWGYGHWWVTCFWATDTDGVDWLLDSLWLRKTQDDDYAAALLQETDPETGHLPRACLALMFGGHDCWNKPQARGASGESTFQVFARHRIAMQMADRDPVNRGRATNRQLAARPMRVRIVKTAGNAKLFDQVGEIMPDENDIRKPGKVDADENGIGGDDGADAFAFGLATRVASALAPKASTSKIEDRGRLLDPKTLTPVKTERPTLDKLLNGSQPARPAHRLPARKWR